MFIDKINQLSYQTKKQNNMKHTLTFKEFLNENSKQTLNENKKGSIGEVKYSIDREMVDTWKGNTNTPPKDLAEEIYDGLSLKSGNIIINCDLFSVDAITQVGKKLVFSQEGEFDMYGGPSSPYMGPIKVMYDNKDISKAIIKSFKEDYGWDDDFDLMRVDVWGHLIK